MDKKILVYSSLFPSRFQPGSGLFVGELVHALSENMSIKVVKPVPLLKNVKSNLAEPRIQWFRNRNEIRVPLFFNFPGILKATDGYLMALSTRKPFNRSAGHDTSLVHAHFAYPDAAAALILCRRLNLPLVVTVHGSDVNILAQDTKRQEIIAKTLKKADAVICVSNDLVKKVLQLGVPEQQVCHVPNGVDTKKFRRADKLKSRQILGIDHFKKIILTVGNLIPIKAYDHLVKALPLMDPETILVMVGQGHDRRFLERLATELGVEEQVYFAGAIDHKDLFRFYSAADFLVISSHSEGWPTIIFEAFACGLPVLANRVGGIAEAVSSPGLGILMDNNDPRTIAKTILKAYARKWNAEELMETACKNSWRSVALKYEKIYEKVLQKEQISNP